MTAWERPFISLAVLLLVVAGTVWAWRRGWLWRFVAGATAVVAALWLLSKELVRRDYRDADGYIDCWPSCTVLQDSVALGIWYGPIVVVVMVVLAAVLAAVTGPRGGRATRRVG